MTRIDECDRIRRTCSSDGTNSFRIADRFGDLRVCARFAVWDLSQLAPDAHLKRSRMQIERQSQNRLLTIETFQDRVDRILQASIIAFDLGSEEFVFQLLSQDLFRLAKTDRANSLSVAATISFPSRESTIV